MINWIAGNWPDGFRCLVNHDGLFHLEAMAYNTEEAAGFPSGSRAACPGRRTT